MLLDSGAVYKLITLYMLNKLDSQLTNAQLADFFIEYHYTDYFKVQQTLSELCESGFVQKVTIRNTSYYNITPDGYDTLALFKSQIPSAMLEDADRFIADNKFELKNEVGTQSDYFKHTNGDYICHCKIMEGHSLLYELNIAVPSEEEAERICSNWKQFSEDIYAYIMKNLLQ